MINTVVIDNGVAISEEYLCNEPRQLDDNRLNILYTGVLNETKGVRELIEVVPMLKKRYPNVQVLFMGEWVDTLLKNWAEQFIQRNKLEDCIQFTGLVTTDQKWENYQGSDIYIHLSTLDGQPLSILEAIGMGLPVIASGAWQFRIL